MTTISPNYANVNFRATEQVQPKKAAETNAQSKPESKGMSNAMKAGIGVGALAVATAVIAGIAIKNKNAAKEAAKKFAPMAEEVGLTPVVYQKLSTGLNEIKKYEKLDYTDNIYNTIKDIYLNKKKINVDDNVALLNMSDLKLRTDYAKELGLDPNDVPKNSVIMVITDKEEETIKYSQLFIFDEMTQALKDIFANHSVPKWRLKKDEI